MSTTTYRTLIPLFEELRGERIIIRPYRESAAIPQRLGFVQEGCLRNNMTTPDGKLRTTLVFSLIPGEWHGERK
jgi:RimJ/RimL family protein N-acetyltransferase